MSHKPKICVVTGSRAEYGLLYWLIKRIDQDPQLALQLVVTGAHLSAQFGQTYQTIEKDGFTIDQKVGMLLTGDSPVEITKSMGLGMIGFADTFAELAPDIVVVLGDRYEILAATTAAAVAGIPIAHLHGGELSEGVFDDAARHSITKLSHLHFVAAEPYRQRVIQLGEQPDRVFNVGATGLESVARLDPLSRAKVDQALGLPLGKQNFLVTYHPVIQGQQPPESAFSNLLAALDRFSDTRIILTRANADAGGRTINAMIDQYAANHPDRVTAHASLGTHLYLSCITHADAVIGNSSSGLIEVPALSKPTVNIGDRQLGRLRASSVIDCPADTDAITDAIRQALSDPFQRQLASIDHPYGRGNTSSQIIEILKTTDLASLTTKHFYDVPALAGSDSAPSPTPTPTDHCGESPVPADKPLSV